MSKLILKRGTATVLVSLAALCGSASAASAAVPAHDGGWHANHYRHHGGSWFNRGDHHSNRWSFRRHWVR